MRPPDLLALFAARDGPQPARVAARRDVAALSRLFSVMLDRAVVRWLGRNAPSLRVSAYCRTGQRQLGGLAMLTIGTPVYLAAGLRLTARALTEEAAAWARPVHSPFAEIPRGSRGPAATGAAPPGPLPSLSPGGGGEADRSAQRGLSLATPSVMGLVGAAELHWIVDGGVTMSGMPHRPAHRPEEVWPVAAFLVRAQGIRVLCLPPRGDGPLRQHAVPAARHSERELHGAVLRAYLSTARDSGIVEHAAPEVPRSGCRTTPPASRGRARGRGSAGDLGGAPGRRRASEGVEGSDVTACAARRDPWPEPIGPALDGQYHPYLEAQLKLWRDGARGGMRVARPMHAAARRLSDADIAARAAWSSGRPPAALDRKRTDRAAIVNGN